MMSVEEVETLLYGEHFATVPTKCPLFPKAISPIPHQTLGFDQPGLVFAEVVSHPAQHRQIKEWTRIALEGAQHKRGPPVVLL
jgi:hypothetical protein